MNIDNNIKGDYYNIPGEMKLNNKPCFKPQFSYCYLLLWMRCFIDYNFVQISKMIPLKAKAKLKQKRFGNS